MKAKYIYNCIAIVALVGASGGYMYKDYLASTLPRQIEGDRHIAIIIGRVTKFYGTEREYTYNNMAGITSSSSIAIFGLMVIMLSRGNIKEKASGRPTNNQSNPTLSEPPSQKP
jgi:hypothetical protein